MMLNSLVKELYRGKPQKLEQLAIDTIAVFEGEGGKKVFTAIKEVNIGFKKFYRFYCE
ncbi:hypothetical protein [cyanobacterium endosymbiont of Rhopalodia gibberula]|uniref:hypothetical protein n=1 Tax=cyanobacterium endosymbiont of Rhopalodia gibberula TaxID=1763363 RepID=UPI0015589C59|nr:hypothetical protein [cyanobacterium endosymbiont of Rhopalodia gibberula]